MFNLNENLKTKLNQFLQGFNFNKTIALTGNVSLFSNSRCDACSGSCSMGCTSCAGYQK